MRASSWCVIGAVAASIGWLYVVAWLLDRLDAARRGGERRQTW